MKIMKKACFLLVFIGSYESIFGAGDRDGKAMVEVLPNHQEEDLGSRSPKFGEDPLKLKVRRKKHEIPLIVSMFHRKKALYDKQALITEELIALKLLPNQQNGKGNNSFKDMCKRGIFKKRYKKDVLEEDVLKEKRQIAAFEMANLELENGSFDGFRQILKRSVITPIRFALGIKEIREAIIQIEPIIEACIRIGFVERDVAEKALEAASYLKKLYLTYFSDPSDINSGRESLLRDINQILAFLG